MSRPPGRTKGVGPHAQSLRCPGGSPGGGAGSARPQGRHHAKPNVASFWPRPPRQSVGEGDMPGLASSPYSRTHRVRPSEKTALRVISGFAPVRPSRVRLASPRRGGLRTPSNKASLAPRDRPIGPPGVHLPPMIMLCPGLRPALPRGRTECVPPRKPPVAPSSGLPR